MDDPQQTADKDQPLRYDVRLLGRILGETVRAQEGDQVFERVERIRQTALRFHRQADTTARHELQTIISGLAEGQAIRIIRASAISRIWPTSPRISTISAVRAPTPWPMPRRARERWRMP